MSVTQNMALEEGSVDTNKTLGIERSAHIVDIGFACTIKSSKVASSERVKDPSEMVFRVLLDETLEGNVGIVFDEVRC